MPARSSYDYAVMRVVPRVERGEFDQRRRDPRPARRPDFLEARIELDEARLLRARPGARPRASCAHLAAIPRICAGGADAGPIGALPLRERFHWLVAPRSTIIQTSPVHSGPCDDLEAELERLLERMVRRPAAPPDSAKTPP